VSGPANAERIAEIVAAAREGRAPEDDARGHRAPKVRRVDWQRPNKFSAEHVRRLRRAHMSFCQTAGTRMSAELRLPLEMEVIDTTQLTWGAAQASLPGAGISAAIDMPDGGLPVLFTAELPLMTSMIERHLGGSPADGRARERKLTDVDLRIARHVFTSLTSQLGHAWAEVVHGPLELSSVDLHPGLSHVAPASEPTLVLTSEVRLAGASHTLSLLIPWRAMERFSDRLSAPDLLLEDPEAAARAMHGAMAEVAVEVRVEAGSFELPLEQVLSLRPGDVIPLDQAPGGAVRLLADDVEVGFARPGRSGTRRAVQIIRAEEPA
jgi:flagellar motor switch protein FliM